jgi:surface polysaccharide O-acyltransferase-like enzyme
MLIKKNRTFAIDFVRFVFAYMVVLFHSLPMAGDATYPAWASALMIICRVTVPFFFITSGYFLVPEAKPSIAMVAKPFRRLFPIYLFWMFVYFLFLQAFPLQPWSFEWKDLMSGGTAYHLWFLPALGFALAFVPLCLSIIGSRATLALCLGLALLGVLNSSYHDVLGLPGEARRGGILVAPMFVYIGVLARRHDWSLGKSAMPCLIAAYILLFIEETFLASSTGTALMGHDFTMATFLVGTCAFLAIKGIPNSPAMEKLARLGTLSLSIYGSHLLFLWIFSPVIGRDELSGALMLSIAAFVCAAGLSIMLRLVPRLLQLLRSSRLNALRFTPLPPLPRRGRR